MNDLTQQELDKAQSERTARAQSALQGGRFRVARISPQQWAVQNGTRSEQPYTVTLQQSGSEQTWACTCMDYRQRGPQILCKHIEGVRLSEAAQKLTTPQKEQQMEPNETPAGDFPEAQIGRALWELRQPLDMSRVKRRQAPGMGSVPYLEGFDIIERANTIFDFAWSFDLLAEPKIVRWSKTVMAWNQQERRKRPVLDADGNPQTEEVGIVYVTGKVTVILDGQPYSHADLGRCIFSGDTPEALDMALAGSATDCLKRCFRQLGSQFGNDLYDKEIAQNAGLQPQGRSNGKVRKYADGTAVNGNRNEQEAYDQYKEQTGKAPDSRDALRTRLSSLRSGAETAKEETSTVAA